MYNGAFEKYLYLGNQMKVSCDKTVYSNLYHLFICICTYVCATIEKSNIVVSDQSDTNGAVQPQKTSRGWKFWI